MNTPPQRISSPEGEIDPHFEEFFYAVYGQDGQPTDTDPPLPAQDELQLQ